VAGAAPGSHRLPYGTVPMATTVAAREGGVNAAVRYRLSPALELQLLGRNLLDGNHLASADAATVLAAGRSLQLSVRGILGPG
jgi:hypothetical protein